MEQSADRERNKAGERSTSNTGAGSCGQERTSYGSGSAESISGIRAKCADYRLAYDGGDVCLMSRGPGKPHENVARCPRLGERNSGRMPLRAIDDYLRFQFKIVIDL